MFIAGVLIVSTLAFAACMLLAAAGITSILACTALVFPCALLMIPLYFGYRVIKLLARSIA